MIRQNLLTLLILCTSLFSLKAQVSYDLISIDTKKFLGNFQIIPGSASNITDNPGFDNHPNFINDVQLVFSSRPDSGMNDIIMYNFDTNQFTNLTRTEDKSEYAPALTDCGLYVSAVTLEEDSTRRLWLYPINMGEPELLYDDIMPVGNYDWYDNIAAMSVEGNPNKLVYPYSKEEVVTLAENVGRSIRKRPKSSQITYLNEASNVVVDGRKALEIMAFDMENRSSENLGVALGDSRDFIWIDKNQMLMAQGNDLYIRNVKKSITWEKIATVSLPGYKGISRMALSPKSDKLVLVMERNE